MLQVPPAVKKALDQAVKLQQTPIQKSIVKSPEVAPWKGSNVKKQSTVALSGAKKVSIDTKITKNSNNLISVSIEDLSLDAGQLK